MPVEAAGVDVGVNMARSGPRMSPTPSNVCNVLIMNEKNLNKFSAGRYLEFLFAVFLAFSLGFYP